MVGQRASVERSAQQWRDRRTSAEGQSFASPRVDGGSRVQEASCHRRSSSATPTLNLCCKRFPLFVFARRSANFRNRFCGLAETPLVTFWGREI